MNFHILKMWLGTQDIAKQSKKWPLSVILSNSELTGLKTPTNMLYKMLTEVVVVFRLSESSHLTMEQKGLIRKKTNLLQPFLTRYHAFWKTMVILFIVNELDWC